MASATGSGWSECSRRSRRRAVHHRPRGAARGGLPPAVAAPEANRPVRCQRMPASHRRDRPARPPRPHRRGRFGETAGLPACDHGRKRLHAERVGYVSTVVVTARPPAPASGRRLMLAARRMARQQGCALAARPTPDVSIHLLRRRVSGGSAPPEAHAAGQRAHCRRSLPDRHGRGSSRSEPAAALLKVSGANETGEPNGPAAMPGRECQAFVGNLAVPMRSHRDIDYALRIDKEGRRKRERRTAHSVRPGRAERSRLVAAIRSRAAVSAEHGEGGWKGLVTLWRGLHAGVRRCRWRRGN